MNVGVFPVRRHYYEPQFDFRVTRVPLSADRALPAVDWNIAGQLQLLGTFTRAEELADLAQPGSGAPGFCLENDFFQAGDAEYWYQLIRQVKPARIFEVGSGHSTLMAARAIRRNVDESAGYQRKHVCIEPYEAPWLEQTGVTVLRKPVEEVGLEFFSELGQNDVLFIDSSHVIRPQGDVLFEYLDLLPALNPGVIVHVHDIFSPKDYPAEWLRDEVRLWNEQYLLEAFLSYNHGWKIVGSLNYLYHHHREQLQAVAPFLTATAEPRSFYMQKVG